jgi:hypothetical protein
MSLGKIEARWAVFHCAAELHRRIAGHGRRESPPRAFADSSLTGPRRTGDLTDAMSAQLDDAGRRSMWPVSCADTDSAGSDPFVIPQPPCTILYG